jgi:hypothetical protein
MCLLEQCAGGAAVSKSECENVQGVDEKKQEGLHGVFKPLRCNGYQLE